MNKLSSGAFVITGSTSGIGLATALEVFKHGTVILIGRDRAKLKMVKSKIEQRGGNALEISCDLSDIQSARNAATEIINLGLPLLGLVNCAGILQMQASSKSAQGWDMSFATNHIGPFVFTEALIPHLQNGANIVFVVSATEDPERTSAKSAGFCGGRYISAEASARGQWKPGGSRNTGFDAYATSKQCNLATALQFAREHPNLHINAVEPGFSPDTALGRDANLILQLLGKFMALFAPYIKYWSTPEIAARLIAKVLINNGGQTGVYYDDEGQPMAASEQVRDPEFIARVVAETRVLLSTVTASSLTG